MLHILLASLEYEALALFGAELQRRGNVRLTYVDSAEAALSAVKTGGIDLIVVGQFLADTTPVDCVSRLVRQNAMINCAMISDMEQDVFHEATEGLGILMQLSPNPSGDDAAILLDKVECLSTMLNDQAGKGMQQ